MEKKIFKKEKKLIKPISPEELKESLDEMVEQLEIQAKSREIVTEIVKEMKTNHGLNPTNLRKAARIIYNQSLAKYKVEIKEVEEILQTTGLLK